MSTRRIKQQVLALLAEPDLDLIQAELEKLAAKDVINALFSAICRSEERVRWHGVSAMGRVVARLADQDMEEARIIMRRLLWSLNDESGGIGWGSGIDGRDHALPSRTCQRVCSYADLLHAGGW